MSTIISYNVKKSNKEHECDFCNCIISKGVNYINSSVVNDGSVYTWKSHIHCEEIAKKLKMFDECDSEGVTETDFYEFISEEYSNLVNQNDSTERNFSQKIDYVLDYHKIQKT